MRHIYVHAFHLFHIVFIWFSWYTKVIHRINNYKVAANETSNNKLCMRSTVLLAPTDNSCRCDNVWNQEMFKEQSAKRTLNCMMGSIPEWPNQEVIISHKEGVTGRARNNFHRQHWSEEKLNIKQIQSFLQLKHVWNTDCLCLWESGRLGCIICALYKLLQLTHSYCKSLCNPPPASDSIIVISVGINVWGFAAFPCGSVGRCQNRAMQARINYCRRKKQSWWQQRNIYTLSPARWHNLPKWFLPSFA